VADARRPVSNVAFACEAALLVRFGRTAVVSAPGGPAGVLAAPLGKGSGRTPPNMGTRSNVQTPSRRSPPQRANTVAGLARRERKTSGNWNLLAQGDNTALQAPHPGPTERLGVRPCRDSNL
jgi:hypothetical protein